MGERRHDLRNGMIWRCRHAYMGFGMPDDIVEQVRDKYAAVAGSELSGDYAGVRAVAEAFG